MARPSPPFDSRFAGDPVEAVVDAAAAAARAQPNATRLVSGLWLVALPLAWAVGVWSWGLPAEPRWGDDWAAYVLQALAIRDHAVAGELALNTLAMQGSDTQIGPYAYPWGYPFLLYLAGSAGDWTLTALKIIGGLSVAGLVITTFLLLRLRVGLPLALLATVLACGQVDVLVGAAMPMSDAPFAFVAALSFTLLFAQYARAECGALSGWLTLGVAVTAAAAFSIRSNGAVLQPTFLAALLLLAARRQRPWRELLHHAAGFIGVSALLVAAYFQAWPDGSLVHANYLSIDPSVWVQRLGTHLEAIWYWFPFATLPGAWKLLTAGPALGLLLACLRWRPADAALVGVYAAGHLALLTLFPFDGGGRYYEPLLTPFFFALALGANELGRRTLPGWPRLQALRRSPLAYAPALVAALGLSLVIRAEQPALHAPGADAPFGAAATRLVSFLEQRAPRAARIGFFRPRALRLLTGHVALSIRDPRHLGRVDWYVWTRESRDTLRQVPREALAGPQSGFERVYADGPFEVFARRRAAPSPAT